MVYVTDLYAYAVADLSLLEKVSVVYETLPGWQTDISGCRSFEELPVNAQKYVQFIESFLDIKGNR